MVSPPLKAYKLAGRIYIKQNTVTNSLSDSFITPLYHMPFRSQAQAAKFFSDPKLRPLAKKWALETKKKIKDLPLRVKK